MLRRDGDMRKEIARELGLDSGADINAIREAVVTREFRDNVGKRALLMIEPYPFLIVGEIQEVNSDLLFIKADFTNVTELDDHLFRVHIDEISVFFIEDGVHTIPDIRENSC